jgi:hypothetical protein
MIAFLPDALKRGLPETFKKRRMVLYNLIQADDTDFEENLDRILSSLYSTHKALKFPLIDSTHFELRWQFEQLRKALNFDQISDGTMLDKLRKGEICQIEKIT